MTANKDQSILDLFGDGKEAQILREGLRALHRERVQAFNVLSSIASERGSSLPNEGDFEIPLIEKMIRRSCGVVMLEVPTIPVTFIPPGEPRKKSDTWSPAK